MLKDGFNEKIKDHFAFLESGPEKNCHINLWMADNCFCDYYTHTGLDHKQRNVVELLMSSKGAFITGADFLIDGGATASYLYGSLKPEA